VSETFDRAKLFAELEDEERFVPHAYRDSRGLWTIGIGRLIDKSRGGRITRDEALYLLGHDVDEKERGLDALEPRWRELDGDRQLVLLGMAFQLGIDGLRGFRDLWTSIREYLDGGGQAALDRAAAAMLDSLWATQTEARAKRLAARMRTG